jgi:hypothetical protein
MYEEEDDDLPLQYRRLTAHLQTGSDDFNRRLAAYLTNQVAIRSAIDQMVTNSFAQQYPNTPQFVHNRANPYPSPIVNPHMLPPSPSTLRSAPYPSPGLTGYRASIAVPQDQTPSQINSPVQQHNQLNRRMSMPGPSGSPATNHPTPNPQKPQMSTTTPNLSSPYQPFWSNDMLPFTTSLPPESQQLLGSALNTSDPFASMLMAGSEPFIQNQYYPWPNPQNPTQPHKAEAHPPWDRMSETLAPSVLDMPDMFPKDAAPTSAPISSAESKTGGDQLPSSGLDFSFDPLLKGMGTGSLTRENSAQGFGSGQITPGEGIWDAFFDEGGNWDEVGTN